MLPKKASTPAGGSLGRVEPNFSSAARPERPHALRAEVSRSTARGLVGRRDEPGALLMPDSQALLVEQKHLAIGKLRLVLHGVVLYGLFARGAEPVSTGLPGPHFDRRDTRQRASVDLGVDSALEIAGQRVRRSSTNPPPRPKCGANG